MKLTVNQHYGENKVGYVYLDQPKKLSQRQLKKVNSLAIPGASCFLSDNQGNTYNYDNDGTLYKD